jgi:hypothetical protein
MALLREPEISKQPHPDLHIVSPAIRQEDDDSSTLWPPVGSAGYDGYTHTLNRRSEVDKLELPLGRRSYNPEENQLSVEATNVLKPEVAVQIEPIGLERGVTHKPHTDIHYLTYLKALTANIRAQISESLTRRAGLKVETRFVEEADSTKQQYYPSPAQFTHRVGNLESVTLGGNRSSLAGHLMPAVAVGVEEALSDQKGLPTKPVINQKFREQQRVVIAEDEIAGKLGHNLTILAPKNELQAVVFDHVNNYEGEVQSVDGFNRAALEISESILSVNPEIDIHELAFEVNRVLSTILVPRQQTYSNVLQAVVFDHVNNYEGEVQSEDGFNRAALEISESILSVNPEIDMHELAFEVNRILSTIVVPRKQRHLIHEKKIGKDTEGQRRTLRTYSGETQPAPRISRKYIGAIDNNGTLQTQFETTKSIGKIKYTFKQRLKMFFTHKTIRYESKNNDEVVKLNVIHSSDWFETQRFWDGLQRGFDIITFNYRPSKSEWMFMGVIPLKRRERVIGGDKKTKYIEVNIQDSETVEALRAKYNSSKGIPLNLHTIAPEREDRNRKTNAAYVGAIQRVDRKPNLRENVILFFLSRVPKTMYRILPLSLQDPDSVKIFDEKIRLAHAKFLSWIFRVNFYDLIALPQKYGGMTDIEIKNIYFRAQYFAELRKKQDIPSTSYPEKEIVFGGGKYVDGTVKPTHDRYGVAIESTNLETQNDELDNYVVVFTPSLDNPDAEEALMAGELPSLEKIRSFEDKVTRRTLLNKRKVDVPNVRIFRADYFEIIKQRGEFDYLGYSEGANTVRVMSLKQAIALFPGGISISNISISDKFTLRAFVKGTFEGGNVSKFLNATVDLRGIPLKDEDYIFIHDNSTPRNANESSSIISSILDQEYVRDWLNEVKNKLPKDRKSQSKIIINDLILRVQGLTENVLDYYARKHNTAFDRTTIEKMILGDFLDSIATNVTEIKKLKGLKQEIEELLKMNSRNQAQNERIKFLDELITEMEISDPLSPLVDTNLRRVKAVDRLLGIYEYNSNGNISTSKALKTLTTKYIKKVERYYGYKGRPNTELFETVQADNNLHSNLRRNPEYEQVESILIKSTPQALKYLSTLFSVVIGIFTIGGKK